MVKRMLPDFRFVIGAILATVLLGVAAFGLTAAVRLAHQAKVSPLETSRTLAFADPADWNQFHHPDGTRRFEGMGRQPDAAAAEALFERFSRPSAGAERVAIVDRERPPEPAAATAPSAPAPQAPAATPEPPPVQTAAVETATVETGPVEAPIAAAAPVAEPPSAESSERVASLPTPPADQEPAQVAEPAAPAGPAEASKAEPQRKRAAPARAAKKKVARARKARARTAARQPAAQTGFPFTTNTRSTNDWTWR
jgi:hypothetical protein